MATREQPQAWLNGRLVPASEAKISVIDAGFVQGTAVAEQVRTFAGRLFHLEDHLARLRRSLAIVGIEPGLSDAELAGLAEELVACNHRLLAPGDDLGLSIVVTPGLYAGYGGQPGPPTVCLHTYALPFYLWAEKYQMGQSLVTTAVEQVSPRSWPASLKCRSRMHYYLADRQADRLEPGARALLLDHEGMVTEASTANVILYCRQGGLRIPPRRSVLQGISLQVVEQLAAAMGIPTEEERFGPDRILQADEVFLSSTPYCLLPVTRFNGQAISGGKPGPLFGRLLVAWSEMVGVDIAEQARRFAWRGG